jgi:hypothetical protein
MLKTARVVPGCTVLLATLMLAINSTAQNAPASRIGELNYFLGRWACSGKFTRSGVAIDAHLQFELILNQSFILFRHDDKPPHNYHAWAEWGWDAAGNQFVSTVQDSAGGTRVFHSAGWQGDRLIWQGGSPGSDDQEFAFERIPPKQFRVRYAVRKDGAWTEVDASTCSQQK